VTPLIAHDNDAWLRAQLPSWLLDPTVLAGLELAPPDRATFELSDAEGAVRPLELRPTGRLGVDTVAPPVLPVSRQRPAIATRYWNKYLPDERMIYFAYDACVDDALAGSVATFTERMLAFADRNPVDRFVIDLRNNGGGDSRLLQPLIDGLAAREALAGRVFAIIGGHTFSSALINAIQLKRRARATLVGGPTGGKPSSHGEVRTFTLPRSQLRVQYSTKLFSFPDFPGDALPPDLPVEQRAADWLAGRDAAIEAIRAARVPGSSRAGGERRRAP
jgi:hypothetical protein